jgi:hypothetical protein
MVPKTTTLSGVLALLISTALQPVAADIDYDARCERDTYRGICLTSFVWCDSDQDECSFPENFYPHSPPKGNGVFAAVLWSQDYNLSWARTDPNYPVLVEWSINGGPSEDVETLTWAKSKSNAACLWVQRAPKLTRFLPTDFTDGETSFGFTFGSLAREMGDDISLQQVQGQAAQVYNGITISQPERPSPDNEEGYYSDRTSQFAIYPNTARQFLKSQRTLGAEEMYNRWRLPVGLAVGLGVPVLMAISGIIGVFFGKRQRRTVPASKSAGTIGE